jgi:hypothetical protein
VRRRAVLRVLHDMSRAQVIEALIAAALIAAPFVIYFWRMTP